MEGAQRETLAANVVADQIVECVRVAAAEFEAQAQMTANEILRNARERERSVLERSYRRSTRERDAARKREDYWKEKALRSSRGLRCELGVSRTARTARGVASELVELFSKKTARFDISTKRAVCEKFWSHPRLNDYHPASTGSAKLDRSVVRSFLGLKEALKKIKGAQRNDHRNTKHNSLVALAGNAVVQGRYQTTLAKALGIKRTNVYRAAKTRAFLDSDDATKFPTGQRRERSDKISAEVRAVVEAFWVAKSRVSPRMKDRDGLGGMNKNALEREQRKGIRGHKLENAADAVQFLTSLRCPNQDYTGKWKLESIHPIKPQDVIAYAEEIGSGVSQGVIGERET
ncbi:hypothetical protein R1sor_026736 [Riccia sorocarpa]|uniref:Uncharacterized protein n=1 Tax=Riccia sorocarpa TaxID=122646 RepID=A0ABD3GC95_9MARC